MDSVFIFLWVLRSPRFFRPSFDTPSSLLLLIGESEASVTPGAQCLFVTATDPVSEHNEIWRTGEVGFMKRATIRGGGDLQQVRQEALPVAADARRWTLRPAYADDPNSLFSRIGAW